jgi:hypothetical protein
MVPASALPLSLAKVEFVPKGDWLALLAAGFVVTLVAAGPLGVTPLELVVLVVDGVLVLETTVSGAAGLNGPDCMLVCVGVLACPLLGWTTSDELVVRLGLPSTLPVGVAACANVADASTTAVAAAMGMVLRMGDSCPIVVWIRSAAAREVRRTP